MWFSWLSAYLSETLGIHLSELWLLLSYSYYGQSDLGWKGFISLMLLHHCPSLQEVRVGMQGGT